VREDNEIITKSMSRVSVKTDNGNQVSKCGLVNSFRPSDVLSSSELSAASAVTLMATTLAVRKDQGPRACAQGPWSFRSNTV